MTDLSIRVINLNDSLCLCSKPEDYIRITRVVEQRPSEVESST